MVVTELKMMFVARIFLFGFLLLLFLPFESKGEMLPDAIGEFRLEKETSGEEARKEINRLR